MLAAGAAEAVERIARHVIAALDRNFLDRICHVLNGDLDETIGDVFRRAAGFVGERGESTPHGIGIDRLFLPGTKNLRKEIRDEFSGHDIGVGDGERSAAPVACRPRICAG